MKHDQLHDSEYLSGAEPSEVATRLAELLQDYERGTLSNYDRLIGAGMKLAEAGHNFADVATARWALERPTALRAEIVSYLLWGLWQPFSSHSRVAPEAVDSLLALRSEARPPEDIDYVILMALAQAAAHSGIREKVRPVLEAALARRFAYPDMDRNLKAAIRRHLSIP
jgi:hypothetical protein